MSATLNPAWRAYNNGMNEGGEGYNPHVKWLIQVAPAAVAQARRTAAPASRDMRLLVAQNGNAVRAWQLAEELAKDERRIAGTAGAAREITQAAIDHARRQLGI